MPEHRPAVARMPALAGFEARLDTLGDALDLRVLPPRARFSLRLAPGLLGALPQVGVLTLDVPVNRGAWSAGRAALRLGPDEWLLLAPEAESPAFAQALSAALAGHPHSLVDIGHRHAALAVAGPGAALILNSGCPLDLSEAAFPPCAATRTLLGKAEVVLARPDARAAFELECGRSYAAYVRDFLLEAARGLGG